MTRLGDAFDQINAAANAGQIRGTTLVLFDALVRDRDRRRAWGEAIWTAPDLFAPGARSERVFASSGRSC